MYIPIFGLPFFVKGTIVSSIQMDEAHYYKCP